MLRGSRRAGIDRSNRTGRSVFPFAFSDVELCTCFVVLSLAGFLGRSALSERGWCCVGDLR